MFLHTVHVFFIWITQGWSQNPVKHLRILFAKIINDWKPLTIFSKCSILAVRQDSEYNYDFLSRESTWNANYV